jgi:cytochrome o ubiquinol oxidase subunit 2
MRALALLLPLGLILFLSAYISHTNVEVLNPKGVIALAEKNLLITALCLMLIVVIPVFVMLGAFLWRYRAGNAKAKYTPDWHSNVALEIVWWAIPTIIIVILALLTWKSTHDLDPYKPLVSNVKPITIQVVALDWKWLFIYPDEHIATVNFLEIPKDTPIDFQITADAPMNAFWIPQLGGQVYAMPGMTAQLHLLANEPGDYKGLSSNFSGDGFVGMKFVTHVATGDEYATWVQMVKASPQTLTREEYDELAKRSKNNPVAYYAQVEENLYNEVIMKFMAPMNTMDGMESH